MKNNLTNIADIKSGFLFKKGLIPEKEGNISVIQLKDIDEKGNLYPGGLLKIFLHNYVEDDCVRKGDILFKAKTNHPVAALVSEELSNTIATAHYFIIRLKTAQVLPAYLSWYLNQKPAQRYFDAHAGGSRIQIINKQTLGDLEVVMPELSVQEKIVKIYNLHHREYELLDLLKDKKQKLISAQLNSAIRE